MALASWEQVQGQALGQRVQAWSCPAQPSFLCREREVHEVGRWQGQVWEPAVFGDSVLLAGLTQPLPPLRWAVVLSRDFDPGSLLSPDAE